MNLQELDELATLVPTFFKKVSELTDEVNKLTSELAHLKTLEKWRSRTDTARMYGISLSTLDNITSDPKVRIATREPTFSDHSRQNKRYIYIPDMDAFFMGNGYRSYDLTEQEIQSALQKTRKLAK